jgi:hypothetical protein
LGVFTNKDLGKNFKAALFAERGYCRISILLKTPAWQEYSTLAVILHQFVLQQFVYGKEDEGRSKKNDAGHTKPEHED